MRVERSLTKAQWDRLAALFQSLLPLPEGAREALIAERCAGDADLEHELRHVLTGAARALGLTAKLADATKALLAPAELDLSGRVLGEHRLVARIDRGGMGVVYRAERVDVGGEVAVKVLLDERAREHFMAEQRLHARLVHPGIPQFHKSGAQEGLRYFVLEYVEGAHITEHCAAMRAPLNERLRLFRGVCEAAQHAHAVGILHCDIKPKNVMVKTDGSVRLLDFGVATPTAQLAQTLATAHGDTSTELAGLTPAYAAPEQLRGETVSGATDVHALGLVLYELLTLRYPYIDDESSWTSRELAERVLAIVPEPPSRAAHATGALKVLGAMRDDDWADLDALVLRALEKDPRRRFADIPALLSELKRFELKRARDAATAEAVRAGRVQRLMMDLMSGGARGEGHRKGMTVEELLDAAVREVQTQTTDPVFQAEVLLNAGSSLMALGLLERARQPLERALQLHESALGGEAPEVARSHVALGRLEVTLDDKAAAEGHARRALELAVRTAQHDPDLHAMAATLLGSVLNGRGRHPEAADVLEAARSALHPGTHDPLVESQLLTELAGTRYYLAQYEESEQLNRESLALERAHLPPGHPRIADTLINLSAIAIDRELYEEAEQHARDAVQIFERFHGEVHPKTGSALTTWALALNMLRRYPEAERLLARAEAINARLYTKPHLKVASTMHQLFTAANMQGQYERAQGYADRLVKLETELHGPSHWRTGHAFDRLGSVRLQKDQYELAEEAFRQALGCYEASFPPGHLSAAIAHLKIGRALIRSGRAREGVERSLHAYETLAGRTPPPNQWLAAAARDLVQGCEALGEAERATLFRARLAKHERS